MVHPPSYYANTAAVSRKPAYNTSIDDQRDSADHAARKLQQDFLALFDLRADTHTAVHWLANLLSLILQQQFNQVLASIRSLSQNVDTCESENSSEALGHACNLLRIVSSVLGESQRLLGHFQRVETGKVVTRQLTACLPPTLTRCVGDFLYVYMLHAHSDLVYCLHMRVHTTHTYICISTHANTHTHTYI
jgi:hypothetical protein